MFKFYLLCENTKKSANYSRKWVRIYDARSNKIRMEIKQVPFAILCDTVLNNKIGCLW